MEICEDSQEYKIDEVPLWNLRIKELILLSFSDENEIENPGTLDRLYGFIKNFLTQKWDEITD